MPIKYKLATYRVLLILIVTINLVACASNSIKHDTSRFKVTVSTDGHEIKDFNQTLIHRVSVKKAKIQELFGKDPEDYSCKENLSIKLNSLNQAIGLEVEKDIDDLNLFEDDVLVNLGSNKLQNKEDFWHLKDLIEIEKTAELTVVREGKPHKLIYNLNE